VRLAAGAGVAGVFAGEAGVAGAAGTAGAAGVAGAGAGVGSCWARTTPAAKNSMNTRQPIKALFIKTTPFTEIFDYRREYRRRRAESKKRIMGYFGSVGKGDGREPIRPTGD
jgi:hypothetical protein